MLEINANHTLYKKKLLNTDLIVVDDFLLYPDKVIEYLYDNEPANLWKHNQIPSNNGKYFIDKRHIIRSKETYSYNSYINTILNKDSQVLLEPNTINSNFSRFIDRDFNNYIDHYWYPHIDDGYNGLLYLNINGCSGTNIYDMYHSDNYDYPEHYNPWRPKNNYNLIYNIESKFNRLVLFDGKLLHGMAINNDDFFSIERINLATFFIELNLSEICTHISDN